MPLKFAFTDRTTTLVTHERGKYVCPLRHPQPAPDAVCPVNHEHWPKGGCTAMMPTCAGARLRYQLDRESAEYKAIYKQRTADERINSQALELGIERPYLRRQSRHRQPEHPDLRPDQPARLAAHPRPQGGTGAPAQVTHRPQRLSRPARPTLPPNLTPDAATAMPPAAGARPAPRPCPFSITPHSASRTAVSRPQPRPPGLRSARPPTNHLHPCLTPCLCFVPFFRRIS